MADAYKGLTIQFGGDTTKLTKALAAAKSAAAETQSQLRLLNQALKFDSGSVEAAAQKIQLMNERAQTLGAQLGVTSTAMEQLSAKLSATGSGQTIGELAASTENAALQAKLALDRYNSMNASLEQLYTKANSAAKGLEGLGENFDLRDADNATFEKVVDQLVKMGALTEEDAAHFRALRESYAEVAASLDDAKAVLKLQQLETETQKLESETKSLSDQMGQMTVPSALANDLSGIRARITELDAAIEKAMAAAKNADAALKLDPTNTQLAEERMQALATASELTAEKARLLGTELDAYKSAGIDKVVSSTEDMATEAAKATEEWADSNAELQKAKGWLQELESQQQKLADAGKQTSDEYAANAEAIEQARTRVEELANAEQQAAQARETAQMAAEYQDLQQEIADAAVQAETLSATIADTDDVMAGVDGVINVVETLAGMLSTLSDAAEDALGSIVDSTSEVSAAFQDMKKTVDGTEDEYEALYKAALTASSESVVSAADILEIEAMGGQLGIAVENLEEFAEVVSNISIASDLETDEAAEQLGELSNILDDLNADTMQSFADALVRLGNNTAASESKISNIATRIGSMASIVGLSTPEILALSATVAETGMKAEAAGTAISNTMSDIETAVGAVAGMTESEMKEAEADVLAFAEIAQMSGKEFCETWENEPIEAIRAFIEGLNKIEEDGGSADATLETLGITGVRQKQAIEGLMQTIDNLDDNLQMSEDAWNGVADEWGAAGDAANEAEQKSEGFSGALERMENSVSNIWASLGEQLTPLVTTMADALGDLSEWVQSLPDDMKTFVDALLGVTATAAPAALGITGLIKGIGSVGAAIAPGLSGLATYATGLGGIAAALAGIVAVAGVVTVVADTATEMKNSKKAAKTYADLMNEVADNTADAAENTGILSGSTADAIDNMDDAIAAIADFNDTIVDTLTEAENSSATLEFYVDTIEELAGQSDLSAYEQLLLEKALEGVNEELGTSYTLGEDYTIMLDGEEQAVEDLIADLDESVEAYKRQAKAAAYSSLMTEATEELMAAQQDLLQAQADYEAALEDTEAYEKWYSGMVAMAEEAGTTIDEVLEEAGVSLEEAWANNVNASEIGQTYQELADDVALLQENVDSLAADAAIASSNLHDSLVNAVLGLPTEYHEIGTDIAYSLQAGIDEGTVSVDAAVSILENVTSGDWESIASKMESYGLDIPESLAQGVQENKDAASTKTAELKEKVISQVDSAAQSATTSGVHFTTNYASGISSPRALAAARSAALRVASTVQSILQFSVPDEGPWSGAERGGERSGRHLAENFAAGIRAGADDVRAAVEEVASAAALSSAIDAVQVETAAALSMAATDVSANIAYERDRDRTDDVLAALKTLNRSVNNSGVTVTSGATYNVNMQALPEGELYSAMQNVISLMQVAMVRGGY